MLHRSRFCVALAAAVVPLFAAGAVRAQTISPTGQPAPHRIVNGQDLGSSERPQNLTPLGVNYYDCTRDMALRFDVALTGFTGQNVQVWATRSGMCTDPLARGVGSMAPTCWQVHGGLPAVLSSALSTHTFDIRVQDLVGPQATPPQPPNPVHEGLAACTAQQGFTAVALTIWFIPVDSGNNLMGTAYSYPIPTDLVGPPAPLGVSLAPPGDTLLQLHWTANVDTDTAGYDIYIDPAPGAAPTTSDASQEAASQVITVCPDASSSAPADAGGDGSPDASGDDGSSDGATAADADAAGTIDAAGATDALPSGCYMMAVPMPPASTLGAGVSPSCADGGSALLAQGFLAEGGSSVTVGDDSGIEGGTTTVTTYGGGISQIPAANLINANGSTSITISDKAVGAYNITGLTNGQTYSVVVAAVDGYGNIGPPSAEQCDFPAPVNDFFKVYRLEGGRAGGGFCTLEAVGEPVDVTVLALPVAALVFGLARRRKRRTS